MKKIQDVNVEEHKLTNDKITVNMKIINIDHYSEIKCFKSFEEVNSLEARKINLLKIQKTIFLNLNNLLHVDFRENKLLKISKHFQSLKNIKTLKLDDNSISYIPNFVGSFEKLETFTICNNNIKYLPTSLQYLQRLKTIKLSNNQITNIPIEFGLLKALECLYIDANHFTEIPTTLCYLKHLSEFGFEWFEFLDPPFQKVLKENIGKTIISLIRNSLQEMIKLNTLYCDLITFIKRNSNSNSRRESNNKIELISFDEVVDIQNNPQLTGDKTLLTRDSDVKVSNNQSHKKMMKIFYAVENNYYGVIKALISTQREYLLVKNADNKTPLYLSIQNNKVDITNLTLAHTDFSLISNSHIYLHKAIRLRDPVLTEKLLNMGIDINSSDDQGATCFHVLFSSFNKQFYKCAVIGDILLRKSCKLNVFNNDSWAPIHIAARRSAKECIDWIITQNKVLRSSGRETFDLNLRGKNKWTPLHLAVNGFRLEETMLLLEADCEVFAKNTDGKLPRKVANGNFLMIKLLRNYENNVLSKKYLTLSAQNESFVKNHSITEEDTSNKVEESYFILKSNIAKSAPTKVIPHNNTNKELDKILNLNIKEFYNEQVLNKDKSSSIKNVSNVMIPVIKENLKNMPKDTSKFNQINILDFNKSKKNMIPAPNKTTVKPYKSQTMNKNISNSNKNSLSSLNQFSKVFKKVNKVNLHFHKEVILNPESSLAEKYESLMSIKFSSTLNRPLDVENVIKSILEAIDLDSDINMIIFVDVLDLIVVNQFLELISFLEMMQRSIKKKNLNYLVDKELSNTINILKSTKDSFKKTILIDNDALQNSTLSGSFRRRDKLSKIIKISNANRPYTFERMGQIKKHSKSSLNNNYKSVKSIPKMKHILKCYEIDVTKNGSAQPTRNDEFDDSEMNEVSRSFIDFNTYSQQPRNLVDVEKMQSNKYMVEDESCNIIDSSWSIARFEENNPNDTPHDKFLTSQHSNFSINLDNTVNCDTIKPDDDSFIGIPQMN